MIDTTVFQFERKKYEGEDITSEVIQAINNRVVIYNEKILSYKEIPVCSVETIGLMFKRTEELLVSFNQCALVIDVTDTDVPEPDVRHRINKEFSKICESVEHVAFITGKKKFFNTLLKFIMFQTNLNSFSIEKTFEDGIKTINKVLSA